MLSKVAQVLIGALSVSALSLKDQKILKSNGMQEAALMKEMDAFVGELAEADSFADVVDLS